MKFTSFIASLLILFCTAYASAYEAGDIIFRIGSTTVDPDSDSSNLQGPAAPLVAPAPNGVEVNDDTQLGFTFTYMLNENIGLDLLAATPFGHSVHGTGTLNNLKIASTKHLPPTLNVQFYPGKIGDKITPYIGLGANYTVFFDDNASNTLEVVGLGLGVTVNDVKLSNSTGLSMQAGADIAVGDDWFANVQLWKLDIDTEAGVYINSQRLVTVDVDIDPLVFMIGVGRTF